MADNVQVVIKVRPLIQREKQEKLSVLWEVREDTIYPIENPEQIYSFDHIFDTNVPTSDIFDKIARPIVDAAVKGINGTLFAYGQTASGKTYTMMGTKEQPGVISLSVLHIFNSIQNTSGRQFLLRVSYLELYNEKLRDLLFNDGQDLKIREDMNGDVLVKCREEVTNSPDQILEIMQKGNKNRTIGETNMNERSSRSHTIFRIIIESREVDQTGDQTVQVAHLNLVDLAGSERAAQTCATGVRLKEGGHINKSLLALSRVIKILSEGNDSNKYVNFRDSKLTRLLQTSLGGNAMTGIICTITPVALDETHSTLHFASTAKKIKNKPHVNEVVSNTTLLKRMELQIAKLNSELEKSRSNETSSNECNERLLERIKRMQETWLSSATCSGASVPKRKSNRRRTWCGGLSDDVKSPKLDSFRKLQALRHPSIDDISPVKGMMNFAPSVINDTPFEEFELDLLKTEEELFNASSESPGSLGSIIPQSKFVMSRSRLPVRLSTLSEVSEVDSRTSLDSCFNAITVERNFDDIYSPVRKSVCCTMNQILSQHSYSPQKPNSLEYFHQLLAIVEKECKITCPCTLSDGIDYEKVEKDNKITELSEEIMKIKEELKNAKLSESDSVQQIMDMRNQVDLLNIENGSLQEKVKLEVQNHLDLKKLYEKISGDYNDLLCQMECKENRFRLREQELLQLVSETERIQPIIENYKTQLDKCTKEKDNIKYLYEMEKLAMDKRITELSDLKEFQEAKLCELERMLQDNQLDWAKEKTELINNREALESKNREMFETIAVLEEKILVLKSTSDNVEQLQAELKMSREVWEQEKCQLLLQNETASKEILSKTQTVSDLENRIVEISKMSDEENKVLREELNFKINQLKTIMDDERELINKANQNGTLTLTNEIDIKNQKICDLENTIISISKTGDDRIMELEKALKENENIWNKEKNSLESTIAAIIAEKDQEILRIQQVLKDNENQWAEEKSDLMMRIDTANSISKDEIVKDETASKPPYQEEKLCTKTENNASNMNEIENLITENNQKEAAIIVLQQQIDSVVNNQNYVHDLQRNINEIEERLREKKALWESTKEDYVNQIEKLVNENLDSKDKITELNEKLVFMSNCDIERKALESQVIELQKLLADQQDNLNNMEAKLKDVVTYWSNVNAKLVEETKMLNEANSNKEQMIAKLENELISIKGVNEKEKIKLVEDLEKSQETCKELRDKLLEKSYEGKKFLQMKSKLVVARMVPTSFEKPMPNSYSLADLENLISLAGSKYDEIFKLLDDLYKNENNSYNLQSKVEEIQTLNEMCREGCEKLRAELHEICSLRDEFKTHFSLCASEFERSLKSNSKNFSDLNSEIQNKGLNFNADETLMNSPDKSSIINENIYLKSRLQTYKQLICTFQNELKLFRNLLVELKNQLQLNNAVKGCSSEKEMDQSTFISEVGYDNSIVAESTFDTSYLLADNSIMESDWEVTLDNDSKCEKESLNSTFKDDANKSQMNNTLVEHSATVTTGYSISVDAKSSLPQVENCDLIERVKEFEMINLNLTLELADLKLKHADIKTIMDELNMKNSELQNELMNLKEQGQNALHDSRDKNANSQAEMCQKQSEYEEKISDLQLQVAELETKLENYDLSMPTLKAQHDRLENDLKNLHNENSVLKANIEQLNEQIEDIDDLKLQNAELETDVSKLEEEISVLRRSCVCLKNLIDSGENGEAVNISKIEQLESQNNKLDIAEKCNNKSILLESQIDNYKLDLEGQQATIVDLNKEIESLTSRNDTLRMDNEAMRQEYDKIIHELEIHLNESQNKFSQISSDYEELLTEVKSQSIDITSLQADKFHLESEIFELKEALGKLGDEKKDLLFEKLETERALEDAVLGFNAKTIKESSAELEINDLQDQLEQLKQTMKEKIEMIEQASFEKCEISLKYDSLIAQNRELSNNLEEAANENERLEKIISQINIERDDIHQENLRLLECIDQLKTENSEMNEKLQKYIKETHNLIILREAIIDQSMPGISLEDAVQNLKNMTSEINAVKTKMCTEIKSFNVNDLEDVDKLTLEELYDLIMKHVMQMQLVLHQEMQHKLSKSQLWVQNLEQENISLNEDLTKQKQCCKDLEQSSQDLAEKLNISNSEVEDLKARLRNSEECTLEIQNNLKIEIEGLKKDLEEKCNFIKEITETTEHKNKSQTDLMDTNRKLQNDIELLSLTTVILNGALLDISRLLYEGKTLRNQTADMPISSLISSCLHADELINIIDYIKKIKNSLGELSLNKEQQEQQQAEMKNKISGLISEKKKLMEDIVIMKEIETERREQQTINTAEMCAIKKDNAFLLKKCEILEAEKASFVEENNTIKKENKKASDENFIPIQKYFSKETELCTIQTENKNLREKCNELEKDNNILKEKLEKMNSECVTNNKMQVDSGLQGLITSENKSLHDKIRSLEIEKTQYTKEINSLKATVDNNSTLQWKCSNQEMELRNIKTENRNLLAKCKKFEKEQNFLLGEIRELKTSQKNIGTAQTCLDLENEILSQKNQNKCLMENLKKLEIERKQLIEDIDKLKLTIDKYCNLNQKYCDQELVLNTMKLENRTLQEKCKKYELEQKHLVDEIGKIRIANQKTSELENALQMLKEDNKCLYEKYRNLEIEKASLIEDVNNMKMTIENNRIVSDKHSKQESELQILKHENKELHEKYNKLMQENLKSKNSEKSLLTNINLEKNIVVEQAPSDLYKQKQIIEELKMENKKLLCEINTKNGLTKELMLSQRAVHDLKECEFENSRLKSKLNEKCQAIETLKSELDKMTLLCEQLKTEIEGLCNKIKVECARKMCDKSVMVSIKSHASRDVIANTATCICSHKENAKPALKDSKDDRLREQAEELHAMRLEIRSLKSAKSQTEMELDSMSFKEQKCHSNAMQEKNKKNDVSKKDNTETKLRRRSLHDSSRNLTKDDLTADKSTCTEIDNKERDLLKQVGSLQCRITALKMEKDEMKFRYHQESEEIRKHRDVLQSKLADKTKELRRVTSLLQENTFVGSTKQYTVTDCATIKTTCEDKSTQVEDQTQEKEV